MCLSGVLNDKDQLGGPKGSKVYYLEEKYSL